MMRKGEKGFTLVEVLIVVAILGVLAAIIVPSLSNILGTADLVAANTEADTIRTAVLAYKVENQGQYPDSVDDIMDYIEKDPIGVYVLENGAIKDASGWDGLEWQGEKWIKVED